MGVGSLLIFRSPDYFARLLIKRRNAQAVVLLGGAKGRVVQLDEIQVHKIDAVEPDGRLQMVISDKSRLPPVIVKGKEHPGFGEPRPQAGLLFSRDETQTRRLRAMVNTKHLSQPLR